MIQMIVQNAWSIADAVNQLRNLQGTDTGAHYPLALTAEMALFVVREACSVAEYVLTTLDPTVGRRTA